jgi:hypothetical protein
VARVQRGSWPRSPENWSVVVTMQRAAGAAAAKGDRADAEARPSVFRKGGSAADHERRTEAVHGDGLFANCDEAVDAARSRLVLCAGAGAG